MDSVLKKDQQAVTKQTHRDLTTTDRVVTRRDRVQPVEQDVAMIRMIQIRVPPRVAIVKSLTLEKIACVRKARQDGQPLEPIRQK